MIRVTGNSKINATSRRFLGAAVLFLAVFAAAVPAQAGSRVNLYGALGFPTPHFDGPSLDLGVEAQVAKKFYLQFMINSIIGGSDYNYDPYGYYPYNLYVGPRVSAGGFDLGIGNGSMLYGISSYGVYKIPMTKNLNLWVKGGIHWTFYDNFTADEEGNVRKNDANGFGTGVGAGFEHNFSDRWGIFGGILHKTVWVQSGNGDNLDDNINWFKVYTGIIFRVSKGKK